MKTLLTPLPPVQPDPEAAMQERGGWLAWLVFHSLVLWHWVSWRHVCAWCQPMRRTSGNPLAWQTTHGCCDACLERLEREATATNSTTVKKP